MLLEKCTQQLVCSSITASDVGSCVVRKLCFSYISKFGLVPAARDCVTQYTVRACIPQPLKCLVDIQHNLNSFHGPPRAK